MAACICFFEISGIGLNTSSSSGPVSHRTMTGNWLSFGANGTHQKHFHQEISFHCLVATLHATKAHLLCQVLTLKLLPSMASTLRTPPPFCSCMTSHRRPDNNCGRQRRTTHCAGAKACGATMLIQMPIAMTMTFNVETSTCNASSLASEAPLHTCG